MWISDTNYMEWRDKKSYFYNEAIVYKHTIYKFNALPFPIQFSTIFNTFTTLKEKFTQLSIQTHLLIWEPINV